MSAELFSVFQFFADDSCERVRENVGPREAVEAARHYSSSVGAQIGTTVRVIITDLADNTVFEWQHGKGVTFPPEATGRQPVPAGATP